MKQSDPEIRIVKGNDFYLLVRVIDNRGGARTPVNLSAVQNLDVSLIYAGVLMKKRVISFSVMSDNNSVVLVKCTGLPVGNYGIEVNYTKDNLNCCAREFNVFGIVYSNKEANILTREIEAEETNAINLKVGIYGIPEGGDTPTVQGKCYFGTIENFPYSIASVDGLTEMNLGTLGKTAIGYTTGKSVVILIPASSSLKGYQDNGFGESVPFNEVESGVQVGCNGQTVTIGENQYKVYGQLFLNSGTCFIYIK